MIMNINYTKQVWSHLRQDPLISTISVLGTALSIFLIMLVVMLQQVNVAPYSPESNRNRFLHASYLSSSSCKDENQSTNNGPMNEQATKELYGSLKTPERVTVYTFLCSSSVISVPNTVSFVAQTKRTDDDFWRVFDFDFLSGKPYDKAAFKSGQHEVVVSESVARKLYGNTNVSGKEISLNHSSYKIVGVVKDVSILASKAYGEIWIPYTVANLDNNTQGLGGSLSVTILAHRRTDFPTITSEVNQRLVQYNKKLKEKDIRILPRNRPYDQEKESINYSSNEEPDVTAMHRRQIIMIVILLLVPAINLSSMTQSRLRKRIAEIGVRRAFGCTRVELLWNILMENLVTSLIAGVLGLILCVVFSFLFSDLIFAQPFLSGILTVNASMLLQPSTFTLAFIFCFVLNLISSLIPAWRASHGNIVNALGGKTR
jgi:putative ABC transport system permease protein